jgi:stage III sporulation protein SpoIIIAA
MISNKCQLLTNNFNGLINTIIISPRRWGKTSLVRAVSEELKDNKEGLRKKLAEFEHLLRDKQANME